MIWDTLFLNCQIATMDEQNRIIQNGALAVQQDKIVWMGTTPQLSHEKTHNIVDLKGAWVLPGFIDCHTHIIYAGNRSHELQQRLQGKTYGEIAKEGGGILATVKATREASFEALYQQSKQRLLALMKEGVTTIEIKSGYGLDLVTERKMLQVAAKLANDLPIDIIKTYLGAHTVPPEYKDHSDDYINFICAKVLPQLVTEELVDSVDGFCEPIAFSLSQIEKVFQTAKSLQVAVKLHAEQLSNSKGAALAAQYQALSADHLEYVDEQSIQKMAQQKTVAVLLPGAYYFLLEKTKPPIHLLRHYHIPLAIASDSNPGTSPICSLLLIANMACLLFQLTPIEALQGITLNAAKALGIDKTHGSISLNKKADITVWDISDPVDLIANIGVFSPKLIIKNGKKIKLPNNL